MIIPVTRARRLLAGACVVLAVLGTVVAGVSMYQKSAISWRTNYVKQNTSPEIKLTPADQEALKMRLDSAARVFQTGLAVTAALWALVIAKKGDFGLNRNHKPEILMFFAANWLLLLSLLAYPTLQLDVAAALSYSPSPAELDKAGSNSVNNFLWDDGVWRYSDIAFTTLFVATLVVACTILSTRLLAEQDAPKS